MPSVSENIQAWSKYDWREKGEEWSRSAGGSEPHFFTQLYPRLHSFLPCGHILEIAVGCGRWAKILHNYCEKFTGVDICENAIHQCKNTFSKGNYYVNDGMHLDCVEDNSVDLVFSFDSLPHAEIDVFESYIPEILRKLTDKGVAFVMFSNIAALPALPKVHRWSGTTVSGEKIKKIIENNGGYVMTYELVAYWSDQLTDCMMLFHKNKEFYGGSTEHIIKNYDFTKEIINSREVFAHYMPRYSIPDTKNTVPDLYFENYPKTI